MASLDERVARLEERSAWIDEKLDRIDTRTAELAEAYSMGRGALWAALKIGGVILGILGGLAWLADHMPLWPKG